MNPFRDRIVASPWDANGIDVPTIHGSVFERCLAALEHVRNSERSGALLIHGEAGSGKTHLLRQLRARLTPKAPADTSRKDCLFTWVRLQTSPRMIWRTLRRALVEDLFRPVAGTRSQFDRILFHRLAEIRIAEGDLELWYEYMLREDPAGLAELMERIATELHLDRNTALAFEHIAFGRHRRDLRAWLAGDSLPATALDTLGLTQEDAIDEEREDEARRVVYNLCALAGNRLPVVIAFDQIEALQSNSEDRDALGAFGRVVGALHDGPTNTLLISSVQSSFLTALQDSIRQADADRITSLGSDSLDPLTRGEALELIAARLASAGDAVPPDAVAGWPLDETELERLFANNTLTPRRLLAVCAERFDRPDRVAPTSEPPPPVEPVRPDEFFVERWRTLFAQCLASSSPDRTETIVRHGLPLAAALFAPRVKETRDELLTDVELVFDVPAGRAGLAFGTQANMTSLAGRLKRLKAQWGEGRLARLVLLRDPRIELTKTAKAARQHLDDLRGAGVVLVEPSRECLAGIDTLRTMLSDAKSGDLARGGDPVTPQEVSQWLRGALPEDVRALLGEILGAAAFEPNVE